MKNLPVRHCLVACALLLPVAACDGARSDGERHPLAPTYTLAESDNSAGQENSRLLYCPRSERAESEAIVGPEGGTVGVAGHRIEVPAGALEEPVTIRVRALESSYLIVDVDVKGLSSKRFLVPARITLSYRRCKEAYPNPSDFEAWYVSDAAQLLEYKGGTVDAAAYTVTFTTDHLSAYALAN